ncbi:MAG: signal peptidase I [Lachnospiraceae bacterium]|nr:signal peptidase I [Lachnospiraceae bacterium]
MAKHKGLSFYRRKKKWNIALLKEIFSWLAGILVALFLAGVLNYFFGMRIGMVGVSMEPELVNGQMVLIDRFGYSLFGPKAGDVVVFLPNGNKNSHYYMKRVVATAGDKVQIVEGVLYVNGEASPWVTEMILDAGISENELVLKFGEYFCIGDNPNNSEDSRSANIGPIEEADIVGRAWFKLKQGQEKAGFIH